MKIETKYIKYALLSFMEGERMVKGVRKMCIFSVALCKAKQKYNVVSCNMLRKKEGR